jgi:hypothetical protein
VRRGGEHRHRPGVRRVAHDVPAGRILRRGRCHQAKPAGHGGGTTQTNTQCFTVESGGSLTECLATVQFGACEPHASVGPCPTDNLSGCCAYYGSSNADAQNNAACYYGLTSASYATISGDCTTGTWTTTLPSGSRWTTVPE